MSDAPTRRRDALIQAAGQDCRALYTPLGLPRMFNAELCELFVDRLTDRRFSEYLDCIAAGDARALADKLTDDVHTAAELLVAREIPTPEQREEQDARERAEALVADMHWEDFDARR